MCIRDSYYYYYYYYYYYLPFSFRFPNSLKIPLKSLNFKASMKRVSAIG